MNESNFETINCENEDKIWPAKIEEKKKTTR